ncbi:MAG: hypothetical protein FWD59_09510, partial [Micrococcales bacterium]|nr:hypothetical protein [Micrococcales bacterium]
MTMHSTTQGPAPAGGGGVVAGVRGDLGAVGSASVGDAGVAGGFGDVAGMHTDAVLELAGRMDPSVEMMGLLAEVEGRELSTRQEVRVFGLQAKVLAWMQAGH